MACEVELDLISWSKTLAWQAKNENPQYSHLVHCSLQYLPLHRKPSVAVPRHRQPQGLQLAYVSLECGPLQVGSSW